MKSRIFILIVLFWIIAVSLISRENKSTCCNKSAGSSRHGYSGIPPAGKTGAPGEGICFDCHSFGTLNGGAGSIFIDFNSGSKSYLPDSTYLIKITVKESAGIAFGSETTILDNGYNKTGSLNIIDSTSTAFQTLFGREYVSHNDVWSNLSSDSLFWEFLWTAPSSNVGPIIIYSTGVANPSLVSSPAGNVYNDSLIIYPDSSLTSLVDLTEILEVINVFPIPSENEVSVYYTINQQENVKIFVYDTNGEMVGYYMEGVIPEGSHYFSLIIKDFPSGIYYISILAGISRQTTKFVVVKKSY
jgi:type IX secretion system substrate protein